MPADPRFHAYAGPRTLAAVAAAAGGAPRTATRSGASTAWRPCGGRPRHVSFLGERRYLDALRATGAGR
jgi:hypothetical protein